MSRKIPKPGAPARGSRTGRPIMVLLDLLGRRWALRVLWELRDGPLPFRALREACGGLSPTVLNSRLAEVRAVAIIASGEDGYSLTTAGRELLEELLRLTAWSERWASSLRQHPAKAPRGSRSRGG